MDGTRPLPPKRPRSRSAKFFFRGLGVVLPSVLTIALVIWVYQFVSGYIAEPLNQGVRWVVVELTTWPVPSPDDFESAAEVLLPPAQRAALNSDLRGLSGDAADAARVEWFLQNPDAYKLARRVALARLWDQGKIGGWVIMDVVGLVVAIILIYIAGVLVGSYIGRRLYSRGEDLIARVPLIRRVYPSVKQVTDFFFGEDHQDEVKFTRVVAVEYPRKGIWSVGLVTGQTMARIEEEAGVPCLTVFIPSSPTPFTGYVITVPETEAMDLDVNIEEALKFAVSLGVLVPPSQQRRPLPRRSGLAAEKPGAHRTDNHEAGKRDADPDAA